MFEFILRSHNLRSLLKHLLDYCGLFFLKINLESYYNHSIVDCVHVWLSKTVMHLSVCLALQFWILRAFKCFVLSLLNLK